MPGRYRLLCAIILWAGSAHSLAAQGNPGGAVAVGVIAAAERPMTETEQFLGRIEAVRRVDLVARVTAFLNKRSFTEGGEVKAGDKLYELEKGPFQADLAAKQAVVAQLQATLENARLTTERAKALLSGPAGLQSNYDAAIATQRSLEAQINAAQAQVEASQINLNYTDITAPIDGKIGRTAVTEGNVVSPSSGVLTTIVSQDPMYVTFPIAVREALALRDRYAPKGGFEAVAIRIRLPNGRLYDQRGQLNFASNTITTNTDTITVRGQIANPPISAGQDGSAPNRELVDGEFVTVLLEGVQPVEVLAVPRAAVLSDQQGSYVFVVGADNTVEQRRVQLGQSTPTLASVTHGLEKGERVVAEGLQRVKAGAKVSPGPASAQVQATMSDDNLNAAGSGNAGDPPVGAATGASSGGSNNGMTSDTGKPTAAPPASGAGGMPAGASNSGR
ncbi:efflux RND transporter periplasmic adaptor subunit [Bradyrhizobium sp. USDA 4353]